MWEGLHNSTTAARSSISGKSVPLQRAYTILHKTCEIKRRHWMSVCNYRATISLGLQKHHRETDSGVVQWTDSLLRKDEPGGLAVGVTLH